MINEQQALTICAVHGIMWSEFIECVESTVLNGERLFFPYSVKMFLSAKGS